MEICTMIENQPVGELDKPITEMRILSIDLI